MESQPRNPEFRNNPENFHPCNYFIPPSSVETLLIARYFVLKLVRMVSFCSTTLNHFTCRFHLI